jgi:hypothetical protein
VVFFPGRQALAEDEPERVRVALDVLARLAPSHRGERLAAPLEPRLGLADVVVTLGREALVQRDGFAHAPQRVDRLGVR